MASHSSAPIVSESIHSFLIGDEVVLFSSDDRRLIRLNTAAAFIWCCLEDGLSRGDTARELSETYSIPLAAATQDVESAISEWHTLGLLGKHPAAVQIKKQEEAEESLPDTAVAGLESVFRIEKYYRLLGKVIRVRATDEDLAATIDAVFPHLEIPTASDFSLALDIQHGRNGFVFSLNGMPTAYCEHVNELGPYIHGQALLSTYTTFECLTAMHAGAVGNGSECVILPAVSGTGKSTLTAALVASGFQYLTDELVLLDHDSTGVHPAPVSLGIKKGSWPILERYHPTITTLPIFYRTDEQLVRYLPPPSGTLVDLDAGPVPVRAILFPKYMPDTALKLERLSPAEALCRVTEAGYDVKDGLNVDKVRRILDWVSDIECYELRYSSLDDAVREVTDLLA